MRESVCETKWSKQQYFDYEKTQYLQQCLECTLYTSPNEWVDSSIDRYLNAHK